MFRRGSLVSLALSAMLVGLSPVLAVSPSPGTSIGAQELPRCSSDAGSRAVAASSPSPPVPTIAQPSELTVFAAASLRAAFEAFVPAVQAATGMMPVYSFDASSALRAQIEQGAPADVFASADTTNVVTLLEAGLARAPVVFACNQLTIIVPTGNPAGIASAADLGRPGVKVIAAGDEVPITRYAMQLVVALGISEAYAANVVSREDNAAAVRSRIELGEGDAAIVYRTDAIASGDKVVQVALPPGVDVPATYAAAIVAATDQPVESSTFLAWLVGSDGQSGLASFGFLPAP
jgi:molybdate transport system substrate-binding protein